MSETHDNTGPQRGGCLCGSVTYQIDGPLRPVIACHCGQCRKSLGHVAAATAVYRDDLTIHGAAELRDYESSPGVRRRFCQRCGAPLFWDDSRRETVSIWAGSLEPPTGLALEMHIFTADKGDYYEITDDLPCLQASGRTIAMPPRRSR